MWVEGWGHLSGQLVVVSGPSGSGKSSVTRRVIERAGPSVELSISSTTRLPRPGEVDGRDYAFTTLDRFREEREAGKFLEWAEYNGNYYGTPAEPVYQALAASKTVLLEIEVNGAILVRRHAPSAVFVFIKTRTFQVLERRLRGRGTDPEQAILRRLRRAREELAEAHWYDHLLVNDDLERCVDEFLELLRSQDQDQNAGG
jgi:guanylate kinase